MKHFFENIGGWFTFPRFYKYIIDTIPSGGTLVEIGTYEGQSFAYLVVEAINSGKEFDIVAIDNFGFEGIFDKFNNHMSPVKDKIRVIKGGSWESASKFEDKSVDFVFIDANHTYPAIHKDITYWLPKIKDGGILAGHDYCEDHPGVIQAVSEIFGEKLNKEYLDEVCWFVNI